MKYDHQWATADDCDWSFDKLRGRHYHSQSKEVFRWENLYLGELNTRMTNWFRIVFTLFTRFPSSCRRHLGLTKSATRPSPRGGRFNTETSGCSSFTWHCREISHRNEILAPVQKLSWARTRMTHSDMKIQTKTTNRHYNTKRKQKRDAMFDLTVSFICIWFILIRQSLCLNSELKKKISLSSTSRP